MAVTDTQVDTSNYAEAMKIRYGRAIVETINRKVILYDMLEKTKEHWTGKQHQVPVYLRSANAVGARNEGGTLPDAAADVYQESIITNKNNYVVVKTTNIAEALTSQGGAWAAVKSATIKHAAMDLASSMNRQLNTGGFGILCEVQSMFGLLVTIHTYGDGALTNKTLKAPDTTRFLKVGLRVTWGRYDGVADFAAANPTGTGHGYVSAVVSPTSFSVVKDVATGGADPIATDVFVIGNGLGQTLQSFNKEMMGIDGVVGSGETDFQSIDATTYPEWDSIVLSNPAGAGTERQLTEDVLQQAIDRVNDESADEADMLFCHTTTRRAYLNLLKSKGLERFAPTVMRGGHKALTYNGGTGDTQIFADKDAVHRTMFVLSRADLRMFEVSPFKWDSTGGDTWKWVANEDAATAFGRTYSNLGVLARNAQARIDDIAVTGIAV